METILIALRVLVALAVVFGLLWYLQRRFVRGRVTTARKTMRLVARQSLGKNSSVAVVDIDDKRFVLGVSDHAIAVLHEGEVPPEPEPVPVPEPTPAFQSFERATGSILSPATWKQAAKSFGAGTGGKLR
jgi:flagellar protein FliO/FliZ